jgi:hypothetical protein
VGGGLGLSHFVFLLGDLYYFRCRAGSGGGDAEGRSEDGGKTGLPALEVALAFPSLRPVTSLALLHLIFFLNPFLQVLVVTYWSDCFILGNERLIKK